MYYTDSLAKSYQLVNRVLPGKITQLTSAPVLTLTV